MSRYLVHTNDEPVGYYYADSPSSAIDMCINDAEWSGVNIKRSELQAVISN